MRQKYWIKCCELRKGKYDIEEVAYEVAILQAHNFFGFIKILLKAWLNYEYFYIDIACNGKKREVSNG